ncbi:hypothetical protein CC86DRAFT_20392 [Ophiobolus disseminans]|uniref:Nucleotide-diphospho-sugar transferase domain-containing protein n=1 Tax=Ophiobolus disseminans TaxID=1469910 RepID=A0A6A7A0W7_9PLEO|nr:hypothetical protein CC86DRAFT_20392 [Ophiobolus disseminans]
MLVDPRMMLSSQRYYIAAVVLFVVWSTLYLSGTLHHSTEPTTFGNFARKPELSTKDNLRSQDVLRDAITTVFKTIKVYPTQEYYRDPKGKAWTAAPSNSSTWTEPLGKKVLIVDIDTRVPTGDNQILQPDAKIDWERLESGGAGLVSHAITNHYLYALIHGYEYRYFQAANMPDHHATWIKPHIFKEVLPDYQFMVFMDADVVISHLEVPLEWMFNRWGIEEHTSIALPHDTEEFVNGKSISTDSKGVPVLNTGFIVTQNNKLTFEMLEAWGNCTTEVRYPGCARWKGEWSHEQRAFSEYIRYDFGRIPGTIVGIPCDDAMGYPGFKAQNEAKGNNGVSDCNGNFLRHYTLGKDQVHQGGTNTMAQALAEVLQKSVVSMQDQIIIKESDPSSNVAWEDQSIPKQAWEVDEDEEDLETAEDDEEGPLVSDLKKTTDSKLETDREKKISLLLAGKVSK